jgi:AraC family transcriptional regulator
MDERGIRAPVDTSRALEHSAGVRLIYRIPSVDRNGIFAAKWQLEGARVPTGNLTHAIVACRTSGSATVARRSRGTLVRRRPTVGAVTYVAPDTPAMYLGDGHCEVFHVYLSQQALERFADDDMSGASVPRIRDLFAIEDPWLKGYFQMLVSEFELFAQSGQHADALFITQAEHLLIHHLLCRHSDAASKDLNAVQRQQGVNPLRSVTLKRVQEYVAANLGRDIRLPDLATISCMSIGHFLRAFRAASGTTPYHYVLEQRLRKASSLLRTTTFPISHIAKECGFKTLSHLSSEFRARVGTSPSRYRACSQGDTLRHLVPSSPPEASAGSIARTPSV